MWRDTGNSRYLADAFGRDALPLPDGGLADSKLGGQFRHAAGRFDRSGCYIGHKRKVSQPYVKVNEAFADQPIRCTYSGFMFKETLKKLRKARGLTQKQLAEKIGVTAPAVTQWEAGGGIDMPNLKALAKALETPLKVLTDALEGDAVSHNSDSTPENLPDGKTSSGNNRTATTTPSQEGQIMGDLRDTIIRDLIQRLSRVEDKLFSDSEEIVKTDPRKRRKV